MRISRTGFRGTATRLAIIAALLVSTSALTGCNAATGALGGALFGLILGGGDAGAAVAGAFIGAGVGAVVEECEYGYGGGYRGCSCDYCRSQHYDY